MPLRTKPPPRISSSSCDAARHARQLVALRLFRHDPVPRSVVCRRIGRVFCAHADRTVHRCGYVAGCCSCPCPAPGAAGALSPRPRPGNRRGGRPVVVRCTRRPRIARAQWCADRDVSILSWRTVPRSRKKSPMQYRRRAVLASLLDRLDVLACPAHAGAAGGGAAAGAGPVAAAALGGAAVAPRPPSPPAPANCSPSCRMAPPCRRRAPRIRGRRSRW